MRLSTVARPVSTECEAETLLRELHETAESLQPCLSELEKVLSKPALDPGALTSVRLKLAGLRLTRGPLINKVSELLSGKVTDAEERILRELKALHHRILQEAAAHTGKWTLTAIARDWPGYRRATRGLMRQWVAKAEMEQRLVHPLLEKAAKLRWTIRR